MMKDLHIFNLRYISLLFYHKFMNISIIFCKCFVNFMDVLEGERIIVENQYGI